MRKTYQKSKSKAIAKRKVRKLKAPYLGGFFIKGHLALIKSEAKMKENKIKLLNKDTGNMDTFLSRENMARNATFDPKLVCCEIYNVMKEDITFENMTKKGSPIIICKKDDFCFLPHQYFKATVASGNPEIRVVMNFGDNMFKGNKKPSNPEISSVK